jgi:cell fate regulator YaaT (PSP1 superfamily)
MPNVIGIRFQKAGRIYDFDMSGFEDLKFGDAVIVETNRGRELGWVASGLREVSEGEISAPLKPILRRATPLDWADREKYRAKEQEALARAREEVEKSGLQMKLIKAQYSFDGSRLTLFFTAENRVDFRNLLRDLARVLRVRIELRQVGVRDEAKLMGSMGMCGRSLCCTTFLDRFNPVSIKMAKQQNLPLSPMEISGACGRLLCCLAYENQFYAEMKRKMPRVGKQVVTPEGAGKVTGLSVLKETLNVELEDGTSVECHIDGVTWNAEENPAVSERPRRGRKRKGSHGGDKTKKR